MFAGDATAGVIIHNIIITIIIVTSRIILNLRSPLRVTVAIKTKLPL